ncbi:MAG TPA: peroxiredoxin [Paracoccaceae bacterium]
MTISVGDKLPEAGLLQMGAKGPEAVSLHARLTGRKVVVFGLPGAFTAPCTNAHVPSFIRSKDALLAKGVDEIICLAVNDPFVLHAWAEHTGAAAAGLTTLGDAEGAFTKAIGMDFSNPAAGLINRSRRYALYAEDGVVKVLHQEENSGICDISGGEAMLAAL